MIYTKDMSVRFFNPDNDQNKQIKDTRSRGLDNKRDYKIKFKKVE